MRWESNNSKWGCSSEGGSPRVLSPHFYEQCQSKRSSNDYLCHYGVPHQKWGVTTKEYVKKGYDRGRQLGYRISGQEARDKRIQREQEEANADHTGVVEKTVRNTIKNAMDNAGLGQFSDMVSDKVYSTLKDQSMSLVLDPNKLEKVNKVGAVTGKGLGKIFDAATPGINKVINFTESTIKKSPKAIAKGTASAAKFTAKYGFKSVKSIIQHRKDIARVGSAVSSAVKPALNLLNKIPGETSTVVKAGELALKNLMRRR